MSDEPEASRAAPSTRGGVAYERDLLARVLQSTLNGIMALKAIRDSGGKIVDFEWLMVNHMAEHMLGRDQDELLGKRLLSLQPEDRENGLFERYVDVVEKGTPIDHDHHLGAGEGWFRVTGVKLGDGIVVTVADITHYKPTH